MVKIGDNKDIKVFDIVCGMELDLADVKFVNEQSGENYYFCSKSCRDHFIAEPDKYAPKE